MAVRWRRVHGFICRLKDTSLLTALTQTYGDSEGTHSFVSLLPLLLYLDGAWMGMVGGHGEWRWTEERKAWWVLAKKDAGVIMETRRTGLRENFTVLIKTLHWTLGMKCHKMTLMRTSLTPASFFIILSSLAFPAPAAWLLCLGLGPCYPLVFEHPHQLPILQVSFPFPPPWR